ncbi:MAG: damage-control phosphatase ARMT1 family protein [Anaerolineae bacterium]
MAFLPPFLMTSEPGSFARETIAVRKAKIIAGVLADGDYSEDVRHSLADFATEIVDGRPVAPLPRPVPMQGEWTTALAQWPGRGWLQLPWYFAEAYFYVRLLAIVGYFDGRSSDPFAKRKQALLVQSAAILPSLAAAEGMAARQPRGDAFALLVRRSLWGNRLDLSNEAILERHRGDASHLEDTHLLVADSERALAAIDAGAGSPVWMICDNSGPEIVSDLHLADWLLHHGVAAVILALKAQPFFVSDAMVADARAAIAYLATTADPAVAAVGRRLGDCLAAGTLVLRDHPFWTGPGFYSELPPDLAAELAGSALVVAKGDVNYRRFLEDRHWPFHTPIEQVVRCFPAEALLLRTLKGELAAGLSQHAILEAAAEGDDWLIAGRHGVAQFVPRGEDCGR